MNLNSFRFDGFDYNFYISNPNDAIQKRHLAGELFDFPELEIMARYIQDGDTIADIGTNVGNHAIYFSKMFPNSDIVVFEPQPEALEILKKNLSANGAVNVDTTHLGVGLSDTNETACIWRGGENNLGGSRVVNKEQNETASEKHKKNLHEIEVITGDSALLHRAPSFMKIDVEGLEFKVLAGLSETIKKHRPIIFIEINKKNDSAFEPWIAENGYKVKWADRHYAKVTNYLLVPVG